MVFRTRSSYSIERSGRIESDSRNVLRDLIGYVGRHGSQVVGDRGRLLGRRPAYIPEGHDADISVK